MVISTKNAPLKPKRKYLPLSLSFDDGDERRRRFQQRIKIREANERALKHRSTIEDFCGAYASVTLNNRKVEIPYIDADPLNLPHAAALPSPAKSRVKPRRNHSIRPKSWIDGDGEVLLTMEHSYSAQFSSIRDSPATVISPSVVAYGEFKRKLDPNKNRLQNKVSTSTPINNSQETTRQTNAEQLYRKKMVSRGSVESNVDSAMQRLRKKVSRSKSSQPPSMARRRMVDEIKPSVASHGVSLDDGAAGARRKKFQRCNSESADAPPTPPGPSVPINSVSIIRGRSKQLQNCDSQCSNSSGGSNITDRQHKNSWLTSAGKIKSAFARVKKRQQSCDGKGDSKINSNGSTLTTKLKSHSVSSEKQMLDLMHRDRAALPKVSSVKDAMNMRNNVSVVQETDIWTVNVGSAVKNTPSSSNESGRVQADADPITMIDSSPISPDQKTSEGGADISTPSLEVSSNQKVPKSPIKFELSPKSPIDRIVTEFPSKTNENPPSLASFSSPKTSISTFKRPAKYGLDRITRHYASSPMLTITQAPKSPIWAPKSPFKTSKSPIFAPKSPIFAPRSPILVDKAPNSAPTERVSCSQEFEQPAKHHGRLSRRINKPEPTHFEFHSDALRLEGKRVQERSPPSNIMSTSFTETTASAEALKRSPIGRSRKNDDNKVNIVTDMSVMFSK